MKIVIIVGAAAVAAGAFWAGKVVEDYRQGSYYQAVTAQANLAQTYANAAPVTPALPDMTAQVQANMHDHIVAAETAEGSR